MGKTFVCTLGAGNFVPGLPFEISEEEAKIFGLEKLLADAVRDGSYAEAGGSKKTKLPPPAEPKEG